MRVRALLAAATAAAALLTVAPPAADAALPALYGTPVDDAQPVNHYLAKIQNDGVIRCSGTLINPAWVLTYQQCFSNDVSPARPDPVGPNDVVLVAGSTRRITAFFRTGYLVLLRLDSPVSSPGLIIPSLALAEPPKFAYARFLGSGNLGPGFESPLIYREGSVMIDAFGPAHWTGATLFARDELSPYEYAEGAQFTDAGGPLLYNGQLVGIYSGSEVARPGDAATVAYHDLPFFSIARTKDWIENTIKTYVPPKPPIVVDPCPTWICGH